MYGKNSSKIPVYLAMSFSSNPEALQAFLSLSDAEQDKFIERARRSRGVIEAEHLAQSLITPPNTK
ncbi:MAG: hypothetical protein IJZ04_03935 [Clostridia bacterium]|nr:hypothetical protein [Clostridia bacterium]